MSGTGVHDVKLIMNQKKKAVSPLLMWSQCLCLHKGADFSLHILVLGSVLGQLPQWLSCPPHADI